MTTLINLLDLTYTLIVVGVVLALGCLVIAFISAVIDFRDDAGGDL